MKIVNPDNCKLYTDDHPTGALGQRYLFKGEDSTPENFMFSIAENMKRFQMVTHRHNFDQFRFSISGDMSMGKGRYLREGHLGYFPEGTNYGPQDDEAGPVALVLQFGGASGYGYMSMEQYREGRESLKQVGQFEGAVFIRDQTEDDLQKKKFSINAIWEETMGSRMLIPAPRYDQAIFISPDAFRWIPVKHEEGVFHKHLGTFSEREASAEMWLLKPGASINLAAGEAAIRLLFVLQGEGIAGSDELGRHYGIQLDPGETGKLTAKGEMKLLSFILPPVREDWTEPELPSFEPVPRESVSDTSEEYSH